MNKDGLKTHLTGVIQRRMDKNNQILNKGKEKMISDFAHFFQFDSLLHFKLVEENKRLAELILQVEDADEQNLRQEMVYGRNFYLKKIMQNNNFHSTTIYMVNVANSCNAEVDKDLYTFYDRLVNIVDKYNKNSHGQ